VKGNTDIQILDTMKKVEYSYKHYQAVCAIY